jgi:hypothetical protein
MGIGQANQQSVLKDVGNGMINKKAAPIRRCAVQERLLKPVVCVFNISQR